MLYKNDFPIIALGESIEDMQNIFKEYFINMNIGELEKNIYNIAEWIDIYMNHKYIINLFNKKILI